MNPYITVANHVIELWTFVVRRHKIKKVSAYTILRMKRKVEYSGNTNLNLEDAKEQLTAAYDLYKTVVRDSKDRRTIFINELAVAKAKSGNMKASNILNQLQHNEEQWAIYGLGCIEWMGQQGIAFGYQRSYLQMIMISGSSEY